MSKRVLEFHNIGKLYRLGQVGTGTLSRDLSRWWTTSVMRRQDPYQIIGETNDRAHRGHTDIVWALRDISFTVNQGDVVGIIGKNGSGKSTLLKVLSRITAPTTGTINIKGRTASLLEVGTGFHQDLTGRDNIYMNGAILGMTRNEITRKLDAIVDFSGVERYLDTPVKRYSSGMMVRLGFAVAAFLEPEILVVDEVLAVGDAEFQKRAVGKIHDISHQEGRTVLFVSHNMSSVTQLCNRGIMLEDGQLVYDDKVEDVVARYNGLYSEVTRFEGFDGEEGKAGVTRSSVISLGSDSRIFRNSDPIAIEYEIELKTHIPELIAGINLYSQMESPLARSDFNDRTGEISLAPGKYRMRFEIPPYTLALGSYRVRLELSHYKVKHFTSGKSDLYFDVLAGDDGYGNVRQLNKPRYCSVIRPDWFKGADRIG